MDTLQELSKTLHRRGFSTEIFTSGTDAASRLRELVHGKTVGYGGSQTLREIGIFDYLEGDAEEVFTHLPGRGEEMERKALCADIFLTSANAITMDGHIVNIDGTGNRVAATCFGPQRVIYFIGRNKIVPTLDDALRRAKEAAVKVARRFERKTPCVTTGSCEECLSPDCVCSITTIHRKKPYGVDITVFLIDEDLGF